MKKTILTTVAVALFAIVGFVTTQNTHASEVQAAYNCDTKAVKGTFTTIRCTYGLLKNHYEWHCDGQDVTGKESGFEKYTLSLFGLSGVHEGKYQFVSQRISGYNDAHFEIGRDGYDYQKCSTLKDHQLYIDTFEFTHPEGAMSHIGRTLNIRADFGLQLSGTEEISGYLRVVK